jgi:hypothetical protein
MTLTINIPDAVAPAVVDNICVATNYDAASGKTKAQWAKEQVIRTVKQLATSGATKAALTTTKATLDAAGIN